MATRASGRRRAERANGVATRARILEVATRLFATGGYAGTSLRQIAASAGIDLATLKYHVGDKPALFGEVYGAGHAAFQRALGPWLARLAAVESQAALSAELPRLVARIHDYLEDNLPFVRITLYGMLDAPDEPVAEEERLSEDAVAMIERALAPLVARGILRPLDTRALVVLLVGGITSWFVASRVRPALLGEPDPQTAAGRQRFIRFFTTLLEAHLLSGAPSRRPPGGDQPLAEPPSTR